MLLEQKNLSTHQNARRWSKTTIKHCLTLWTRSPQNYQNLKHMNIVTLPYQKTLRVYKNSIDQEPRLKNHQMDKR